MLTIPFQGLENNDGIFMVASTNHLDKLDPGLSSRPSRFDRKYLFPLPAEEERKLYCQFWRARLKAKKVEIEFPEKICPAVAIITDGFSFAYMQEAFVASLLAIAGRRSEILDEDSETPQGNKAGGGDDGDRDLNDYELWREIKKTVKSLRDDMDNTLEKSSAVDDPFTKAFALEKVAQGPAAGPGSPSVGQSKASLPVVDGGSEERPEDTLRVQGKIVKTDHQHVPIITEENTFMYSVE